MQIRDTEFTDEEELIIARGLREMAEAHSIPHDENDYIYGSLYDGQTAIGFIKSWIYHDWLYISDLWVHKDYRGQSIGSSLLQYAENKAKDKGIENAHLWTASYEAPEFYIKNGYQLCLRLENKPKGHDSLHFRKTL